MNGTGETPGLRFLAPEEVEPFVQEVLFSSRRSLPVVGFTTPFRAPLPFHQAELIDRLGSQAILVALETGEATWALTAALPQRFDVYRGAVRIWWPGITAEDRPEDHPLLLVMDTRRIQDIPARIEEILEQGPRRKPAGTVHHPFKPVVLQAKVVGIQDRRILVSVEAPPGPPLEGLLAYSGISFHLLVQWLRIGQDLPVWRLPDDPATGLPRFSSQKLLPGPWQRFTSLVAIGEVVRGVVRVIEADHCRVEVLPGVLGRVRISEIAWDYVNHPEDHLKLEQEVAVRVQYYDFEAHILDLSIKAAAGHPARESLALVPGGLPFPRVEAAPSGREHAEQDIPHPELAFFRAETERLRRRLEDAEEENRRLAGALSEEKKRSVDLRRQLRSEQDRRAGLERRRLDPLGDERSFLACVRIAYAQTFDEEDRHLNPLMRMRVGSSLMDSLRRLEGLAPQKIVQVCAQVASGRAHEIPGREVHPLRIGPGGSPQRIRPHDRAQAWRCSLQDGTASARRLHWWLIPAEAGAIVEFAGVGVHDDEAIAE